MHIALVTETYPPEVNGVAMTWQRLCAGLARRGHEVVVIRPRQGEGDLPREDEGIAERPVPGLPLPGYAGLHFGLPAFHRLRRAWRERRPEVVHVATEGPLGWSAIRAARSLGIPVGSSFHTNFHSYGRHYGFGLLERMALAWLRHVHNRTAFTLAPSQDVIETLSRQGFQNVGLLSRGVDTRLFQPGRRDAQLRREWGADERTPVALYVGRLAAEKNIPLTVEAFAAFREVLPAARLVLVGEGPEGAALRRTHPEFVFSGLRRGEDLARHYASADVFLFASVTETFGNVLLEAMASGLVAVAYDYAAARQHIRSGQNGFTAPFNRPDDFREAARQVARHKELWHRVRAAARETALGLSWDSVLEGYEERLHRLAASAPPR